MINGVTLRLGNGLINGRNIYSGFKCFLESMGQPYNLLGVIKLFLFNEMNNAVNIHWVSDSVVPKFIWELQISPFMALQKLVWDLQLVVQDQHC